ncbi:uncharacterized protein [Henckelia pumila]|uniref:uncharacterized protein n=1 Tax=Henckelia pumila TaxID=405737 RepID=UPI003C6E8A7D
MRGCERGKFCMLLWSIWKQRNEKVWNNSNSNVIKANMMAQECLSDWMGAKQICNEMQHPENIKTLCTMWHKPAHSIIKCNVDAAFFGDEHKYGIGCLLRDEDGKVVSCRTCIFHGSVDVMEGEAMGLLEALVWVHSLGSKKIFFELDAKGVVDTINADYVGVFEFTSIVHKCKDIIRSEQDFFISFARRQANECTHALAKASSFYVSPTIWSEPPSFISSYLNLVCKNTYHYQ